MFLFVSRCLRWIEALGASLASSHWRVGLAPSGAAVRSRGPTRASPSRAALGPHLGILDQVEEELFQVRLVESLEQVGGTGRWPAGAPCR